MHLLSDLRFIFRLLKKQASSSAMAVLVMAVGSGVAITMFAFVNGIMWSSLNLKTTGELLSLRWEQDANNPMNDRLIKPDDYEVFKEELESFEQLEIFAAHSTSFYNPGGNSLTDRYDGVRVTHGFFDLIGEPALLGRTFLPDDVSGSSDNTVIISYPVWQEQFGGQEEAIGANVILDSRTYTVAGVMKPGFEFPSSAEIWVATDWQEEKKEGRAHWRGTMMIGLLKENVGADRARAEIATVAQRMAEEFPDTNEHKLGMEIKSFSREFTGDEFENLMYAMLVCAALVLAVACANVFNVIMARASKRTTELSIRSALGATRSQIVFQVVLDGLLLTVLGSLGGVLIAGWSLRLIESKIAPMNLPYWWNMDIDGAVVGFIVGITILSALLSSLVPGLRAARSSTVENLKDDARTSSSLFLGLLSKLILSVQIVFTGLLLFVGVMMMLVWNYMNLRQYPFETGAILQANIGVSLADGALEKKDFLEILDSLKQNLEAKPGVESITYSPMYAGLYGHVRVFEMDGESYESEESKPHSNIMISGLDYDKVYEAEPLVGRYFDVFDTEDSELVCMVNKAFADHFWPGEDPMGKRMKIHNLDEVEFRTVVGVMPNLMPEPLPGENVVDNGYTKIYMPHSQNSWPEVNILLRSTGDPRQWIEPMRRELQGIAPQLAFQKQFLTIREIIDRNMVGNDILMGLFGVFGIAALIKASIGLYAVMSFSTRQRFREFGIRMALGADSRSIMALVLRQGALLMGIGSVLGIALGHVAALIIRGIMRLEELPIGLTYPVVTAILILSSIVAMGVPAWRITRVSPMTALRVD